MTERSSSKNVAAYERISNNGRLGNTTDRMSRANYSPTNGRYSSVRRKRSPGYMDAMQNEFEKCLE
jgi:hypothetical protein